MIGRFFQMLGIDTIHEFMLPALTFLIVGVYVCFVFFRVDALVLRAQETLVSMAFGYWFRAATDQKNSGNEG